MDPKRIPPVICRIIFNTKGNDVMMMAKNLKQLIIRIEPERKKALTLLAQKNRRSVTSLVNLLIDLALKDQKGETI